MGRRIATLMLPLAVLGLSLMVYGCGGGDDEASGQSTSTAASVPVDTSPLTTSPLAKPAYIKRFQRICNNTGSELLVVLSKKPADGESDEEHMGDLAANGLIPVVENERAKIHNLGAPRGDKEQIETLLTELQAGIDSAKERDITSLEAFGKGFERYDRLTVAYGLEGCGFELA